MAEKYVRPVAWKYDRLQEYPWEVQKRLKEYDLFRVWIPKEYGGHGASALDRYVVTEELLAASLASCTAITMEMYAQRKGWDIGEVIVDVDYEPSQRGSPTRFEMVVTLPKELPEEQRQRLMQIAAKCPVHRTLEGEVMFEERVQLG